MSQPQIVGVNARERIRVCNEPPIDNSLSLLTSHFWHPTLPDIIFQDCTWNAEHNGLHILISGARMHWWIFFHFAEIGLVNLRFKVGCHFLNKAASKKLV